MTGFKLTYAPHRNDHMAAATDEEGELLVNFFKTNQSVKEGRIGIVVEDEGGAHQHIHAYWEVPAKTTAQKMESAMRAQKAGLVGKLRMEGNSWLLETMPQSQTFYMSYGGYCRKEKHRVLYEHDVTEQDKDLGAVQWGCLRKAQAIKLTENSIMDTCLAYREQHGIESIEFAETLFHMIHNGFSYGYFVVKKGKMSPAALQYFRAAAKGFESAKELAAAVYPKEEYEGVYGQEDTNAVLQNISRNSPGLFTYTTGSFPLTKGNAG